MKIALLTTLLVSSALSQEWPQYLGPNGDGTAEGQIPASVQKDGPKTLWTAKIGKGCSSFAISHGRAITVGNSNDEDTIWCFDTKSGEIVWKKTYPEKLAPKFYDGGPGATPTIDGDRVFVLSKSGRLSCHDFKTGDEKWMVNFKDDFKGNIPTWGYSSAPVAYGDLLLCLPCTKGAAMVALDKATGKEKWKSSNTARPGYSAPVFFKHKGNDAALVFHGRNLVGYDLSEKGEVLFTHGWRTPYDVNASNPVVHDGLVYIASGYGMGYAVLDITGDEPKVLHKNPDLRMIFQNALMVGDDVMGCFGDKSVEAELFRMDLKSGEILWRHRIPGTRASTAKIGETFVLLSEEGDLIFGEASEAKFTETGRHKILGKLCWAPLAIGDGKVFARTNQGDAICVDLSDGPVAKAAPKSTARDQVKIQRAKAYFASLTSLLEMYRTIGGMYPSQVQGLNSLHTKPVTPPRPRRWTQAIVEEVPNDPWGTAYQYSFPGNNDPAKPEVTSAGPDQKFGTPDDLSSQK